MFLCKNATLTLYLSPGAVVTVSKINYDMNIHILLKRPDLLYSTVFTYSVTLWCGILYSIYIYVV